MNYYYFIIFIFSVLLHLSLCSPSDPYFNTFFSANCGDVKIATFAFAVDGEEGILRYLRLPQRWIRDEWAEKIAQLSMYLPEKGCHLQWPENNARPTTTISG